MKWSASQSFYVGKFTTHNYVTHPLPVCLCKWKVLVLSLDQVPQLTGIETNQTDLPNSGHLRRKIELGP